ncbi:TBC1 domain family member 2B [Elysia marginata]|uniref:TBC1 domain family member 2B n=1 Tax=Elysia marginata TaxID=1093978 RepID=A0AAV4HXX9_9GAST|nr:TBC1 domain family member 2B [Elysia marginata]
MAQAKVGVAVPNDGTLLNFISSTTETVEGDEDESSIEVISGPPSTVSSMESSQVGIPPPLSPGIVNESTESSSTGTANPKQEDRDVKLAGWLKLCGQGFRKAVKKFWFSYNDDTGKLSYYRDPQDLLPLGEIDLRSSSLTYDASNKDKPGVFEISSGGKTYSLDALDRVRMFFWLDALQKKRRVFSQRESTRLQDVLLGKQKQIETSGLLNTGRAEGTTVGDSAESNIDEVVMRDKGVNRTDEASKSMLLNIREELRKTFTSLRLSGRDRTLVPSEAWSVIEERPSASVALEVANRTIDRSYSQTQWHVELSDTLSSCSPHGSAEELLHLHSDPVALPSGRTGSQYAVEQNGRLRSGTSPEYSAQSPSASSGLDDGHSLKTQKAQPFLSSSVPVNQPVTIQVSPAMKSKPVPPQDLGLGIPVPQQAAKPTVLPATSTTGKFKFMNALRGLKITKEPVKEQPREVLQEEQQSTEDELRLHKEMLRHKQKELDVMRAQMKTREECVGAGDDGIQEILRQRDKHIMELEYCRQELIEEKAQLSQELRCLQAADACRAYEAQNQFLTSEILEQKALRENDEAREKVYIMNAASLEAKYYKMMSKYLFLLDEVKAPVRGGEEAKTQDVVNRLLEEALDSESAQSMDEDHHGQKAAFISSQGKEYDHYGFLKYNPAADGALPSRAKHLNHQANELDYMIRDADDVTSKKIKWENFMVGVTHSGRCLTRSPELKALLRLGVPKEFRERIWKGCIDLHVKSNRIKLGDNYYRDLQERAAQNKSNPAIKQIELDLLRTLPDNCHFQKIDSEGICKLRRVLLCYSVHNPCIGYCQGINRIAAIALLFLREEDAFWCLVAIVDQLMPADYYTATLAGAQSDQRVLKDLVAEKCPRLHAHLELHEVDLSLFTFNWFLTVFVDGIYPELFLNIWDVFLYEGSKVLFRFGLAFLKNAEEEILNLPSNLAINRYMRTLGESLTDVRRIQNIAFGDLNPFPMRNVTSKRQYHLQQIKAELEELEAIRKDLRSSHEAEENARDEAGYISDGDWEEDGS